MSAINNLRVIAKICEMYYLMDMSQKEIAARFKLSRPHVCRILARARESGIVEIRIKNDSEHDAALEHQLIRRFDLGDAFVVHTNETNKEERDRCYSREAAAYLETFLSNGMQLGVMSGKTVAAIANQMQNPDDVSLGEIIPLVGGIGTASPDLHANSIAMQFAKKYHSTSLVMNAPLLVSSAQAATVFRQEASIAQVLDKGRHCDITIVGIGNANVDSTTARAGSISAEDLEVLNRAGAVCSICTSYFDDQGREVSVLAERSIGLQLKDLKKSRVIACALGQTKIRAIHAALLTRYVNVLMTDADTAERLLAYNG